jgi:hypothetical protein
MNALTPTRLDNAVEAGLFQSQQTQTAALLNPVAVAFAMGAANIRISTELNKQFWETALPEIGGMQYFARKGMEMYMKNMGFKR